MDTRIDLGGRDAMIIREIALYVSLWRGDTEISGAGYARVEAKHWAVHELADAESPKTVLARNLNDVAFGEATRDWGPATHWGLSEAPTGAPFLRRQIASGGTHITRGAAPRFPALSIEVDARVLDLKTADPFEMIARLERALAVAAATEREAIATMADALASRPPWNLGIDAAFMEFAAAIRRRA